MKKFRHDDSDERSIDTWWQGRQDAAIVIEAEMVIAQHAEREAARSVILNKYGFDIGTRDEANNRSGPYADPTNAALMDAFYAVEGVRKVTIEGGAA